MTAEDYKEKAEACRELARHSRDPDHRKMLLEMAEAWEELSDSASKTRPRTVPLKPFRK
jgi:hypothetical protein